MAIQQLPKNPSVLFILVQGLQRFTVVNVKACENRRNGPHGTVCVKEGAVKDHVLDVCNGRRFQNSLRMFLAKIHGHEADSRG